MSPVITTVKTIDLAEARKTLLAIIEEKGADFVYKKPSAYGSCVNWVRDTLSQKRVPSCIAGHAYAKWGVLNEAPESHTVGGVFGHFKDMGVPIEATDAAKYYLRQAQTHQDTEDPWGVAESKAWKAVQNMFEDGVINRETEMYR